MKNAFKGQMIFIAGGVLLLVLSLLSYTAIRIGSAYRQSISTIGENDQPQNATHITRQKIRKITVGSGDNQECIEVTPDGAVRVYKTCGNELETASRLSETRNILSLFKIVSETNIYDFSADNSCITKYIVVEYDDGQTRTVCLSDVTNQENNGNNNAGGIPPEIIQEIIKTIDQIKQDIPPTPTPVVFLPPSPTPGLAQGNTPTPTLFWLPPESPTPGPTVSPNEIPFTCDFSYAPGKPKPHIISNIICSSGPTPGP